MELSQSVQDLLHWSTLDLRVGVWDCGCVRKPHECVHAHMHMHIKHDNVCPYEVRYLQFLNMYFYDI